MAVARSGDDQKNKPQRWCLYRSCARITHDRGNAKHALGAKGKAKFSPHGEAVNGTNHAEKGKGFCLPHKHADSTKKARFRRELTTLFAARSVVNYRADGHVQLYLLLVRRHSKRRPAGPSAGCSTRLTIT